MRAAPVGNGSDSPWNAKYPSTPYWPWSPSVGRGDDVHSDPDRFVGADVVVTEKLDGGNTTAATRSFTPARSTRAACPPLPKASGWRW